MQRKLVFGDVSENDLRKIMSFSEILKHNMPAVRELFSSGLLSREVIRKVQIDLIRINREAESAY